MCGLAGFLQPAGFSATASESIARDLAAKISHRGPDDSGIWLDADAGVALGHRRLAIIDLSTAGRQPMVSASGRYVIVYNGEIYNHMQMRQDLALAGSTPAWRGHSDTETLLAAIDHWGVESALVKSAGMFAFALWDREQRTLTLARDRIGEKPLYYGWQDKSFLFGSELKALRAHPAFATDVDHDVLARYLQQGYVPAPYSIYSNIFKVLPGTFIQLTAQDRPGTPPQPRAYWSLREVAEYGMAHPFAGDDEEAAIELDTHLRQATMLQMVADVPLGAFLSGGIDSSTIVALMQQQSSRPVKTFTIGFHEDIYNEAEHAKRVARHLGTDHTELYVTPAEAMEIIPSLPRIYDEPFGDSSAVPTFLVSQMARKHVTVSLSGDSGDELFCGYTRYRRTMDIWNIRRRLPGFSRRAVGLGLNAISLLSRGSEFGVRTQRLASHLAAGTVDECYRNYVLQRQNVHDLVPGAGQLPPHSAANESPLADNDPYAAMMYIDAMSYLPDDILAKVDRAAMDVSLETRVPFLDHKVLEFVWSLPTHMKNRQGEGKWVLKQVLRKYIPDDMLERPKMGFGVPVGQWLREPLRDWAENLLSDARLRKDGFLNPRKVRQEWSQHLQGDSMSGDRIWQILMFQAWLANLGHE